MGEKVLLFFIRVFNSTSILMWSKMKEKVESSFPKANSVIMWKKKNFMSPQTEKKYPKRGELFSFFEIFTAEFGHFLVRKNSFFVTKKWLNSAVKISKNEKSSPFSWVFFSGWRHKKNFPCALLGAPCIGLLMSPLGAGLETTSIGLFGNPLLYPLTFQNLSQKKLLIRVKFNFPTSPEGHFGDARRSFTAQDPDKSSQLCFANIFLLIVVIRSDLILSFSKFYWGHTLIQTDISRKFIYKENDSQYLVGHIQTINYYVIQENPMWMQATDSFFYNIE